ncbi:MAG: Ig-like domain-containing protein [Halieaceae bacterium]
MDWEQIEAGWYSSLARKADGSLWSWGNNGYGQLGRGVTTVNYKTPGMVGTDKDWRWVSAAGQHALALKNDGSLWSWGYGHYGALGHGDTVNATKPTRMGADYDWAWVSTGSRHSAAIKANGSLWTWGYGYSGRLGHGNTTQQNSPLQVGADNDWVWVSAGAEHTLALKADGSLWSWGKGHRGRLGHGDTEDQLLPIRVGTDADWVWVSAGAQESFAMRADGTLWSWGYGAYGHLGQGDALEYHVPTQVLDAQTGTLVQASKGGYFTTGITVPRAPEPLQIPQLVPRLSAEVSTNDSVKSLGTTVSIDAAITGATYDISQVEFFLDGESLGVVSARPYQLDWVAAAGFHIVHVVVTDQFGETSISEPIELAVAGDLDTTFSGNANQAYSWGNNYYLETGQGPGPDLTTPTQLGTETHWAWLAAQGQHGLGLKRDGTLWSWGQGDYGNLGHGDTLDLSTPKQIGADQDWAQVSAGSYHSLAVRQNGTLWSWGFNNAYQLGRSYLNATHTVPGQVGIDNDWSWVDASGGYSLALKSDGTLWSWGKGGSWLGRGGTANQTYPQQINPDMDWAWASAGSAHAAAVKSDGSLWIWGLGNQGRLGLGGTTSSFVPTQVGADSDWTWVSAGAGHTLALKSDGSLWSWGYGYKGAHGQGDTTDYLVPTRVGVDMDWVWVHAGTFRSFALKADGTLWSWGQGSQGELGHGDTLDYLVPTQVVEAAPGTLADSGSAFAVGVTVAQVPAALQVPRPVPQLAIATTSPQQDSVHFLGTTVSLEAEVLESSNTVAQLEFFLNGVSLGVDYTAPYQLDWIATPGTHNVRVQATDVTGATRYADSAQFSVPMDVSSPFQNTRAQGFSWGSGQNYRTGQGSQASFNVPTQLGTESDWAWLSAGYNHGLGLKQDGTLWSWGKGAYKALGHGNNLDVGAPLQVGTDQDWKQVIAKQDYSLALKADGSLWGWGYGSTNYPRVVGTDKGWRWVAASSFHVMALKDDGSLWTWGDGTYGALGHGNTASTTALVKLGTDQDWAWISAGMRHSAAIKSDGSLWTWGWGYAGRLGHGNSTQQNAPLQVGTDTDWAWVSAGADHTLALKTDGSLWSWGMGTRGRLGHGDTVNQLSPMRVGAEVDWVWVSAGAQESFAMKADGTLWSWGYGLYGHLGQGDALEYHIPTQVVDAPPGMLVQASQTGFFAMGVTVPRAPVPLQVPQLIPELSAEVSTTNSVEVLGSTVSLDATITGATYRISQVEFFLGGESLGVATTPPYQLDWTATAGFHTLHVVVTDQLGETSVSEAIEIAVAGDLDTTFSGTSNQAYSWGQGYYRATGQGSGANLLLPTQIGSEAEWAWLSAGGHFGLGIKLDGSLWSWGEGQYGRLGHGDELDVSAPQQVGTTNDWARVSAGSHHSVALKWDGSLWSWGYNHKFQLGQGSTYSNFLTPAYVNTDRDWAWVSAGSAHNLALKTDGTLWSWGWGIRGQLGTGTTADKSRPVQITTDTDWAWIDAGESYSVALKTDGTLWTWGQGSYGRLGHGDTAHRYVPTQVGTASDWVWVSAGWGYTMALKADGSLWSWGYGWKGALGHGDTENYLVPTRVGTDMDWVWISAGYAHSFALKADGSLWSWGAGSQGELGLGDALDYLLPTQVVGATPGMLVDASDYSNFALGRTVLQTPEVLQPPPAQMYPQLLINAAPQGDTQVEGEELALTGAIITSTAPIARVDFLVDGIVVDSDADAPYHSSWTVAEGAHELTAVAVDDLGATGTAEPITITGLVNTAPAISGLTPADQSTNINGTVITLSANATDAENNITGVAFYVDGVLHDEVSGYPYETSWQLTPGAHEIKARVIDTRNAFAETPAHTITGVANAAPTATLTAPTVPSTVEEGDLVTLTASADDTDGDLESVTFYLNGYALATVDTAPFTYTWTAEPGTYSVTAMARDVWGWEGQSEGIPLTVTNALPPPTAPPVVTSAWTPQDIYLGQEQTYHWSSTGAANCVSGSGTERALSGSEGPVTPGAVGNYTAVLSCTGTGGTTTSYAPRTVSYPQPPTVTAYWEPAIVAEGTPQTYFWESTYAKDCVNGNGVSKGTSGSYTETTPVGIYQSTLTCEGWLEATEASTAFTREVIEAPTVNAYWQPEVVDEGIPQTYHWSSTNMTTCINGNQEDLGTSGESTLTSLAGTYTATLSCTGRDGLTYTDVSQREVLPPSSVTINAAPSPAVNPGAESSSTSDSVGAINGAFSVGPAGQASYSIPFVTAPGVAGVAPRLGLRYSSGGGNGIAGKGMALTGLSSISRCRQTAWHDNNAQSITFSDQDRFCLNGQRLILVNGTEGADGAEYRTEIDSYRRIFAHEGIAGTPDYFTITAKDGSTTHLGKDGTNDVRHFAYEAELDAGDNPVRSNDKVLSWSIARFEDRIGNKVVYEYDSEGNRLETVRFAYVAGVSKAHLSFSYNTNDTVERPDPVTGFVGGYRRVLRDRLDQVTSYNDDNVIRQYTLDYHEPAAGVGFSRVKTVTECGIDNVNCLQPTTFEWSEAAATVSFASSVPVNNPVTADYNKGRPADLNGDGKLDLVWATDGGTPELHVAIFDDAQGKLVPACTTAPCGVPLLSGSAKTWRVLDYNGDGSQDVAYVDTNGGLQILLTERGHTAANFDWVHEYSTVISLGSTGGAGILFADLNADGLADLIYEADGQPSKVRFMQRAAACPAGWPAGLSCAYELNSDVYDVELAGFLNGTTNNTRVIDSNYRVADFDGDGRVDLFARESQLCDEAAELPPGEFPTPTCSGANLNRYHAFVTASIDDTLDKVVMAPTFSADLSGTAEAEDLLTLDLNGDGLSDVLYLTSTATGAWKYRLNNGAGFIAAEPFATLSVDEAKTLNAADVNRDGYRDVVIVRDPTGGAGTGALVAYLWQPDTNGFSAAVTLLDQQDTGDTARHLMFDVNGDGVADHVDIGIAVGSEHLSTSLADTGLAASDRITRISNGLGREVVVDYSPLTVPATYTRDDDASAALWTASGAVQGPAGATERPPLFDVLAPIYVVDAVCSTSTGVATACSGSGNAGVSRQTYSYAGAKAQASGRGFLGFREMAVVDAHRNIESTTRYRQDYPFTGRVDSLERRDLSTGNLLSSVENSYSLAPTSASNAAIWSPYLATSEKTSYDPDSNEVVLGRERVDNDNPSGGAGRDAWGNLTHTRTEYFTGTQTTADSAIVRLNEFGSEAQQELGQLQSATVTHERAGETATVRQVAFTYDANGLLETERLLASADTRELLSTHSYHAFGNRAKTVTSGTAGPNNSLPQLRTQEWTYEGGRYLDRESVALDTTTSLLVREVVQRDGIFGLPAVEEDAFGVRTERQYGALGRLALEYSSTGAHASTSYAFSHASCPAGTAYAAITTHGGGSENVACFDALGREVGRAENGFAGGYNRVTQTFDDKGDLTSLSEPFNGASGPLNSFAVDQLGRISSATAANSATTSYVYSGFTQTVFNDQGQESGETRNSRGELVRATDEGGSIDYGYDAAGNLLTTTVTTGADVAVSAMTYDNLGRKLSITDPDKGNWTYEYNAFGEVIKQITANGRYTEFEYDNIGRLVKRWDRSATGTLLSDTLWTYGGPGAPWRLTRIAHTDRYVTTETYTVDFTYDSYGRQSTETFTIGGLVPISQTYTYDEFGRPFQVYGGPGEEVAGVEYDYNGSGYRSAVLESAIASGSSQKTWFTINGVDARGNATVLELATGVNPTTINSTFQASTGFLSDFSTEKSGTYIQDVALTYDSLGNVDTLHDKRHGNLHDYTYDTLNRLTQESAVGAGSVVTYEPNGNIKTRDGVTYGYGANGAGPHAVTSANGVSYQYDANGNMVTDGSRDLNYTVFDKPHTVNKDGNSLRFVYGPDRQRFKQVAQVGDKTTTTYYVAGYEIIHISELGAETIEYRRNIEGIAQESTYRDMAHSIEGTQGFFFLRDHLGSVDVILTDAGVEVSDMAWGPWGQRRDQADLQTIVDNPVGVIDALREFTHRGYTGHEMLDYFGLIHMNGRIYDPALGRFLSADPIVQAPTYTQSFNRYSYVFNNPMALVDPSGYQALIDEDEYAAAQGRGNSSSVTSCVIICNNDLHTIRQPMVGYDDAGLGYPGVLHWGFFKDNSRTVENSPFLQKWIAGGSNSSSLNPGASNSSFIADSGNQVGETNRRAELFAAGLAVTGQLSNSMVILTEEARALQSSGLVKANDGHFWNLVFRGNQFTPAELVRAAQLTQLELVRVNELAGGAGFLITGANGIFDAYMYHNGSLSEGKFIYRHTGTVAVLALTAAQMGGAAAIVGVSWFASEQVYEHVAAPVGRELIKTSNFINSNKINRVFAKKF